ncbi:MAG: SRPBCC domain-containing protein [Acidimicrobiales bacterium]|nr:SRPBCC domain-containing protein [Acidimicrobiales bacterium]
MTDPTDDPSGAEPSTGAAPDPEAPSADAAAAAATAGPPRTLELEVEVVGTPEAVWQAIATGPGISSWYVPHTVEERPGGAATASFGDAPEMQIPGRVAAWDPPRRIVFDGGEGRRPGVRVARRGPRPGHVHRATHQQRVRRRRRVG